MNGKKIYDIAELLDLNNDSYQNKIAFRYLSEDKEKTVTYGQTYRDIRSLGAALFNINALPCHIGCISENRYEWINTFLTSLHCDSVFVPLPRDRDDADLISLINHSDCEIIFCSERFERMFRKNEDKLPRIKYFICFDRNKNEGRFLSYNRFLWRGDEHVLAGDISDMKSSDSELPAMLVYNCENKGVLISESNIIHSVTNSHSMLRVEGRCLAVMPLSHIFESVCDILTGLYAHNEICINSSSKLIEENLLRWRPTYIMLPPSLAESFYNSIDRKIPKPILRTITKAGEVINNIGMKHANNNVVYTNRILGGKLKKIICGGAPLPQKIPKLFKAMGIEFINAYGMTEATGLICADGIMPGMEADIRNVNRLDNGDIYIKGPTIAREYYKDGKITEDGWLATGDIGHVSRNKKIVITGRKKHIVALPNAKKISLYEIERLIQAIPYVKEVLVYGIKHGTEEVGLCAEIYMEPDSYEDFDSALVQLQADVMTVLSHLPSYKQISRIVARPQEFPKDITGKIKRIGIGIQQWITR